MALVTGRQLISLRLQEMPALDQLFTTVENYPNMTMEYLLVSFVGLSLCIAHPFARIAPLCFAGNAWPGAFPRGSLPPSSLCYCLVW